MGPGGPNANADDGETRRTLANRLRAREEEIAERVLAHVEMITDGEPDGAARPTPLRRAVRENLRFALHVLERGPAGADEMIEGALRQARVAARNGVSSDTILRRFAAGERLFADIVIEEAHDIPLPSLHRILSAQREVVDWLLKALARAHAREREARESSAPARLEQRVVGLLAGDRSVDPASIDYPVEGWHVGLVMVGQEAESSARALARSVERRCLAVPRAEGVVWAWIGGRSEPSLAELEEPARESPAGVSIAIGEPRRHLTGWRQTHEEARAAFQVMRRRPARLTRARDVLLLAAVLRDDVLARSLRDTYMAPLDGFGSSARALRDTLRAYLELDGNAVTAAAALGVDRHTVHRRLRKIEDALGAPLRGCHGELAVALQLEGLDDSEPGE
jgi:hypothetical protein